MSLTERERACVVRQVASGQFSQGVAAERLGIGLRQMRRLMRQWRASGDAGLVSRQRGHRSNRGLPSDFHSVPEEHLRGQYQGFGATLAAEKLAERDGIKVSAATVRRAQIRFGLWRPKSRRQKRLHQLRERRARFGELIQIDGSPHAWFEGRGPRCTLIVFIDDATNCLTALNFAPSETTRAYLEALRGHVLEYGRPLAFYSDRHGIFRVNAKDAKSGTARPSLAEWRTGWGLGREANRGPIHALTPQAKGRVERANQTLQDRLVKEMRLQNISSIEATHGFCQLSSPPGTRDSRFRPGLNHRHIGPGWQRRRHWMTCWHGARSEFCPRPLRSVPRARSIASKPVALGQPSAGRR